MSIGTSIEDGIMSLLDMLHAEPDPAKRLDLALTVEHAFRKLIRAMKQESAYEARMLYTTGDIARLVNVERKSIEYLIKRYMESHPYKDAPPHHNRSKIEEFVDLTGVSYRRGDQADTTISQA